MKNSERTVNDLVSHILRLCDTMTQKISAKLGKTFIYHIMDYDADIDYLTTEYENIVDYDEEADEEIPIDKIKIISSMRYGEKELMEYGDLKVLEWIKEDHKYRDSFYNGSSYCIGIRAETKIETSYNGSEWLINEVSSGGLWGIDCPYGKHDRDYESTIEKEELMTLKDILIKLGFKVNEINKSFKNLEVIEK